MHKFLSCFLAGALLVSCTPFKQEKGIITINNTSAHPVSDVSIHYKSAQRIDTIGDIPSHASYQYPIHYTDAEDSLDIRYTDHNDVTHAQNVVSYAAKYDKEDYTVTIE